MRTRQVNKRPQTFLIVRRTAPKRRRGKLRPGVATAVGPLPLDALLKILLLLGKVGLQHNLLLPTLLTAILQHLLGQVLALVAHSSYFFLGLFLPQRQIALFSLF